MMYARMLALAWAMVTVLAGQATAVAAAAEAPNGSAASARPNLVLICLEGVSATTTGFGGHPEVKTPRLDRLASESVQFTRAYTPMPQSAGARASMLTGQYPHTHGVTSDDSIILPKTPTITEILARAGYTCGLVGTWVLPQPPPEPGAVPPQAEPVAPAPNLAGVSPHIRDRHPPERPLPGQPGAQPPQPGRPGAQPPRAGQPGSQPPLPQQPATALTQPAESQPAASQPAASQPAGSQPAESQPEPELDSALPEHVEAEPSTAETESSAEAPGSPAHAELPPPKVEKPGLGFQFSATSALGGPLENAKVYIDGQQETADTYLPDWHTDRAIDFIQENRDRPFMLCLFLPGPPEPLEYPPGKEDAYPPANLSPPTIKPSDPTNVPNRVKATPLIQKYPKQTEALRQARSKYYAFVSHLDENIGRVLDALEEAGLDERTWVVVTADQGFATGHREAWGTGPAFWEELIRCPLLIRVPAGQRETLGRDAGSASASGGPANLPPYLAKQAATRRVDCLVSLIDIAPTLLEAAGLPTYPSVHGRSLMPLIRRGEDPRRPAECFVEYEKHEGQPFSIRALVTEQYKFIDYAPPDSDLFYDLKRDPGEERNLTSDLPYKAVVKVMQARLDHWRKRTRDEAGR